MPELPDLHIYAENLKKRILDTRIESVSIFNPRKIDRPGSLSEALTGTSIRDITRNGKELFFSLQNGSSLSVHLMLNGKMSIVDRSEAEAISGKMAGICFEDARMLVIADWQGLCKISLNPKIPNIPDALSETFTLEYFLGVLKKNSLKNIKAVLIDQHVVRGIGNAYVDEILWKAGISPESIAGKIPEENAGELYRAISAVLRDAIEQIQKIAPDIISGEERSFLRVHNPRKKFTDDGDKIIVKQVATKTTYFTEKQRLFV